MGKDEKKKKGSEQKGQVICYSLRIMSLVDQIRKDMFDASKKRASFDVQILKIALASIKNEEIKRGEELSDSEIEKVLRTEVKKIEDSIVQYEQMGRKDLVEEEEKQLSVLEKYLPTLMSEDEVRKIVEVKALELGISSADDTGRLMGMVMKELNGKADGAVVRQIVQEILS